MTKTELENESDEERAKNRYAARRATAAAAAAAPIAELQALSNATAEAIAVRRSLSERAQRAVVS